jgi:class 3 adenylate cyclase
MPRKPTSRRLLATVLFTDIVGSTRLATQLGDGRWREGGDPSSV